MTGEAFGPQKGARPQRGLGHVRISDVPMNLTLIDNKPRELVTAVSKPSARRELKDTPAPCCWACQRERAESVNPGPPNDDVVHHGIGWDEREDLARTAKRDAGTAWSGCNEANVIQAIRTVRQQRRPYLAN